MSRAPGVVKAPGYETPATAYIDANPTSIYSDHSFSSAVVNGKLVGEMPVSAWVLSTRSAPSTVGPTVRIDIIFSRASMIL